MGKTGKGGRRGGWVRALPEVAARIRYRLGESGWANPSWAARLRGAARTGGLRPKFLRQARDRTERNILFLYLDMFWAGIFMAVIAFNGTYALRLGAPNTLLGWLSSVPSLIAMLVLVPSARFLEAQEDRGPWLRWSLAIGRGLFLGTAVVPWIFPGYAAQAVVVVLILRTLPMQFYSAGFSPMLADVIPVRDRARVMANRSIIMSATVAIFTSLFGLWMDAAATIPWATFPVNYQLVYFVGTVAGMLSTYFVSRIELPRVAVVKRELARELARKRARSRAAAEAMPVAPDDVLVVDDDGTDAIGPDVDGEADDAAAPPIKVKGHARMQGWAAAVRTAIAQAVSRIRRSLTAALAPARDMVRENPGFAKIVVNTFIFDTGAWLVGPLYTILFVNQLGASDSWIGLNTTLAHIGVIGGNLLWRRLMDRWGAEHTLRRAVPLAASYAVLVALFPNLTLILLFGVLINLVNPGVTLSHTNTLYQLCPRDRRASFMAIYATVANVGAFVAPMLGVALSNRIDIRWILLAGGLIRLAGAGMFQLNPVHLPEAELT